MRIDALAARADRAGRHTVTFSDGSVMRLYRRTIEDFGLFVGLELTDNEMKTLKIAAEKMSAKMRAVRIVAASNVSKTDLEQRLIRKGENKTSAQEAVQWMVDLNLVDDAETAREKLHQLAAEDTAIIYITEQLAVKIKEDIDKYKDEVRPAIILILGKDGVLGIGMRGVHDTVERAVGADILNN